MKFTAAALFSSAVVAVSATSGAMPASLPELFNRIPQCANQCIADAMPGLCPSVESYWCRCHSSVKGRLMSKTFDCAMEACGGMQQALEYQEATNSVCDDIMEVTLHGQKHVELRAVASGSAMPSGSMSGSVMPTKSVSVSATRSVTRSRGSMTRGSTRAMSTGPTGTAVPPPASGSASSSFGSFTAASVAGLAVISLMGMLI